MTRIFQIIDGEAEDTYRLTAGDVAASLASDKVEQNGRKAKFCTFTVETNSLRIALGGAVPTQTGSKLGHLLYAGDVLTMSNAKNIQSLQYINDVNGSNAVIQVTLEF